MNFFKQFFNDVEFDGQEVAVRCPFSHKDENGNEYFENVPSAHVNTEKGTFHCKVCDEGFSETKFLAKMNGISYREARQLLSKISGNSIDTWERFEKDFAANDEAQKIAQFLGFSDEVIKELRIGHKINGISFPVFMYGELLDIRTYVPNGRPKVKSEQGAQANLIIPFDIWLKDDRPTFIMAGEKDMAIARTLGYNAITFTGGEQAFPKLFKASFKGKKTYIVYDNDDAGKKGARKVAALLKEVGAIPFVVEGHHEVVTEKGGDFWDYIKKYNKTKVDFDKIIENTQEFTENDFQAEKEKIYPTVNLLEATKGQYRNQLIRSSVQVTATFDSQYGIPDYVKLEKVGEGSKTDVMEQGEIREWSLSDNNIADILMLMDSNLKEDQVNGNLKELCGVPKKEKGVRLTKLSYDAVFKATVTDMIESDVMKEDYKQPLEVTVYTVGMKLESGRKYKLTYKIVPHPLQAQEMVMLVTNVEQSDDTVTTFKVTDQVKETLKVFQGEVNEKMSEIYDRAKGLIGSFANENIVRAIDLTYHSPLEFTFGRHKIRGVMDSMIVGESRTGKSASAIELLQTYELGTFSTLKNATVAGLIGGSNKVQGSFKTVIGTIPRNHKGLVVFEEFSGADPKFISAATDIRSSGQVRLTRVNGELQLPANLRMLTISNQKKNGEGFSKPLKNYPSGVEVLVELIGAAEDIARYDFFVLVGEPSEYDDPLAFVDEPFSKESYKNRVRWVWSRNKDQIKFENGVERFIIDKAKELNKDFNTHVKFFGSEAWKKLAKISVAAAGCVVSTDESFENIIVKKEHVEWAANFLVGLYDNDLFRLRQFVQEQRRYSEVDDIVIERVQELYAANSILLSQMETTSAISSKNLQAVSGLDQQSFSTVLNTLASLMLFQWQGDKVVPSERFRKAMSSINRNTRVKQPGEVI